MLPKISCVFHHGEIITNFCTQKSCLLPLCPCCVKIHTAQHMSMRTTPQYEQINELLNEIAESIGKCSRIVENDLHSIKGLQNMMRQAKSELFERVDIVKRQVIRQIHEVFSSILEDIQESFHNKQIQQKIDEFQKVLNKQQTTLSRLQQSLYTTKAMRTVIKFQSEDIVKKCQLAHSINEQLLQLCQPHQISLDISQNSHLINKLLKEQILNYQIRQNKQIQITPYDFLSTIQPLQQKSYNSPSQHPSKRSTSQDRRNKQGIRLVGLQKQLEFLDQTKKTLHNRKGKATELVDCLKDSPLEYRSVKTINPVQHYKQ